MLLKLPRSGRGYHGNQASASYCVTTSTSCFVILLCDGMGCTSSKSQQVRVVTFQESEKKEKRNDETKIIELDVNENSELPDWNGPKFTDHHPGPHAGETEISREKKKTSASYDKGNELQTGNVLDLTDSSSISNKETITLPKNETKEAISKSSAKENAWSKKQASNDLQTDPVTAVTEEEAGLLVSKSTSEKTRNGGKLVKSDLFKSVEEFRDVDSYALEVCEVLFHSDSSRFFTNIHRPVPSKWRCEWLWIIKISLGWIIFASSQCKSGCILDLLD